VVIDNIIGGIMSSKPKIADIKLSMIMSSPVLTVKKEDSVREAAKIMYNNRIGSVVVVDDDGRVVGIVTERDLIYLIALGKKELFTEYPVWQIMTENPITGRPDESVIEALTKMKEAKIRHLPVVDDENRPIGMVSIRDILEIIVSLTQSISK